VLQAGGVIITRSVGVEAGGFVFGEVNARILHALHDKWVER